MNENTPCFVYGYGNSTFHWVLNSELTTALFVENGGIYCVPNLRGGGEYGEEIGTRRD